MRRLRRLVLIPVAVSAAALATGEEGGAARPADGARASEAEVLDYEIEATADMTRREIRGHARMRIPSSALGTSTDLDLDLASAGRNEQGQPFLDVKDVRGADGLPLAVDRDASRAVARVRLRAPVGAGERAEVHLQYSVPLKAKVREDLGYDAFFGEQPGELWFPDVVGPNGRRVRFRDFRVTLSYPSGFAVLTSGVRQGPARRVEGQQRATYVAKHVEGFALNLGEGFELTEVPVGQGPQVLAFSPPSLTAAYRKAAELAAEAVGWYRRTYGFFPAPQIGIAPGHPRYRGGFPASNLFYVHRKDLSPGFLRMITAHELGHYYWGRYVLSDSEDKLDWLMLANGIWADQLLLAQAAGHSVEQEWRSAAGFDWFTEYAAVSLSRREQRLDASEKEEEALDFDYNTAVRHAKGAVGVHLQARRIGAPKFLDVQRALLAEYRYKPLAVNEFASRLEAAGAKGASGFFDAFRRGDAVLGFDVASVDVERSGTAWTYRITVERTGNVPYPVTVEVMSQTGEAVRREISGEQKEETVNVSLTAPLSGVRLDPDGALPISNSAHPAMQRVYGTALAGAGHTEMFLSWAARWLSTNSSDTDLRTRLARRLLEVGRYREVIDLLGEAPPASTSCVPALILARAWARSGDGDRGRSIVSGLREGCLATGREEQYRKAVEEIETLSNPLD